MSAEGERPVAVVTGGTTGIGLATARELLASGHRVAVFSQQSQHVETAGRDLAAEFGDENVFCAQVDLSDSAAIGEFFESLSAHWASPAVLVCNAGYSPKRPNGRVPFADIALEEWNQVLAINLTGAMLCCQATIPAMVERGFGRIVFIGSVAARTMPRIAGASYVSSKAALVGLARALVAEHAGRGITINTVAPGRIVTEMTGDPDNPANREVLGRIPTGRLGRPEDVAAVVRFLASTEASFVNGAIIDVNGGEFTPA